MGDQRQGRTEPLAEKRTREKPERMRGRCLAATVVLEQESPRTSSAVARGQALPRICSAVARGHAELGNDQSCFCHRILIVDHYDEA